MGGDNSWIFRAAGGGGLVVFQAIDCAWSKRFQLSSEWFSLNRVLRCILFWLHSGKYYDETMVIDPKDETLARWVMDRAVQREFECPKTGTFKSKSSDETGYEYGA